MLHASETLPLTKTNLQRLQRNDRAMIRQICSIKPEDVATVRSSELLAKLEDLDLILIERRLSWFGHVKRSSGAIRRACDIQTDGRWGPGRPKHARIQQFSSGGVQVNLTKKALTFFFLFFFLSSTYFTRVKWLISKKITIFQGSKGVQHLPGGATFSRGVQLLILYKNPYNL